ncbi:hypothetical protein [Poriferisphaera sp. WC338]|uniref:hypothetical protein n=1 Tax=Poriferisphaera sp. WC338 TaxID=3425129 RepID=UPI003D819C9C
MILMMVRFFEVKLIESSPRHIHYKLIVPSSGYVSESYLAVDKEDDRYAVQTLTYEQTWKRIDETVLDSYIIAEVIDYRFPVMGEWRFYDDEFGFDCTSLHIDVSLSQEEILVWS